MIYLPKQGPGLFSIRLTELYKTFIQYYNDSLLSAMLQKLSQIFPAHQLGTAYALIFFIQNIGLWGIPTLIGIVLDKYCVVGKVNGANLYDYTLPMCIFTGLAVLSLIIAFALKVADKKFGYKLEEANIK